MRSLATRAIEYFSFVDLREKPFKQLAGVKRAVLTQRLKKRARVGRENAINAQLSKAVKLRELLDHPNPDTLAALVCASDEAWCEHAQRTVNFRDHQQAPGARREGIQADALEQHPCPDLARGAT